MRVLLADDSDLMLERLQEMVSRYKQVEIVGSLNNGTETLDALRILKPDMAIVDFKMPGLSGLEVLTEIKKENPTLIFVLLTLYSSQYLQFLALQAGADYFFSKADDFDQLQSIVSDMVMKENIAPELDVIK